MSSYRIIIQIVGVENNNVQLTHVQEVNIIFYYNGHT